MAVVLPVTSLFLGLHTIYFAVISLKVGLFRAANMPKGNSYESVEYFKNINSAQSNFGQYFPIVMLLLATLEANEVMSQKYLLVLSAVITAIRIGHTLQLAMPQKLPIVMRQVGFLSTVLFFIVCGAACVVIGLQGTGLVEGNLLSGKAQEL
ncbi:hypothetical protein COCSUDRAFT_53702 [Coccomyxa subellipsoidea C-169]|uniref:Uncharacterized protein n=1 Tax=Coccomyxa subellipsoidea (strain C-169) TaxID=574566 RepID=I0YX07_COCSC|nr:hypothetical protein COCSUDRAFT_53702 [Coccomyxa subellipsoidea C-169]EIE22926.1 hypothetical protein COCSUDRAFT_53702 [Coccomyxa subellipsoidea C-169]|eukprot:XP_005647470.1 hypothetical protein COCSUDRAFT_53702 [Coccomyxa subellipsoidea C-169]